MENDEKDLSFSKAEKLEEPDFKKPRLDLVEPKKEMKIVETKADRWKRLFTKRTVKNKLDEELREYFIRKNNSLALKLYVERE